MTRKDFILIAAALATARRGIETNVPPAVRTPALDAWQRSVHAVTDALATTNPAFNRTTFVQACDAV